MKRRFKTFPDMITAVGLFCLVAGTLTEEEKTNTRREDLEIGMQMVLFLRFFKTFGLLFRIRQRYVTKIN